MPMPKTVLCMFRGLWCLAFMCAAATAQAEDSPDDLVAALAQPPVASRSASPQTPARGADLIVAFEGQTHRLTVAGMRTLRTLAAALQNASMRDRRFAIIGHAYVPNQPTAALPLSAQRARAVADHLAGFYGIDPARLAEVRGEGADQLRSTDPADPMNNRIEVVNTGLAAQ